MTTSIDKKFEKLQQQVGFANYLPKPLYLKTLLKQYLKMIYVIIGTKAQLIKMAPLLYYFKQHHIDYHYISTGQHRATINDILENFKLPPPDCILYEGKDITSITQMFIWSVRLLYKVLRQRHTIFPSHSKKASIVLVHGDTFSTLLGALMAKIAHLKVGHVESGLRSFNWFHPFPEEITRVLTFKLSDYFFCPGEWAKQNLAKEKGIKINTGTNTLYEALQIALPMIQQIDDITIPTTPYAVATLHRYENVYNKESLERIVQHIEYASQHYPILFILHKPTEINLRKFNLLARLEKNPRIELRPRYDYFRFIKLLINADCVISDGGSNQEECYYLGKPILLLRKSTERQEGLGKNCLLSGYKSALIEDFFNNIVQYKHAFVPQSVSPCECIASHCQPFIETSKTT